jgi:hypothetical protein
MLRLREELNPEEQPGAARVATTYPTTRNRHGWHCRECGGLFYVDDAAREKVRAAVSVDPTENPFLCDDCEEAYADEAYHR